jgi:arsenate reductase (thioredoxin)
MMAKTRVLFVCVHNAARSQMAEAFMNHLCVDSYEAESAGLEPTGINPLVVEAMKEIGIDISRNTAKSVFDFFKEGRLYGFVITVCDEANAELCPIFPGIAARLHWSFDDPSTFTGTHEEQMGRVRVVRDSIRARVLAFCENQPRVELK